MTAAPGGDQTKTVVITGASSGIGRATAHRFSRRGMNVVLAARDPGTLEEAALECKARGAASVLAVPTDVTEPGQIDHLAEAAAQLDGIDVWVNDAAVMAYGRLEDVPRDVYRQVIEVNLFGAMECSRAALRRFRGAGRGHLINIGSLYAKMTSPLVGPYVVSKFGLLGFSEVLRQELLEEPDIHVSVVLPGSMDSPIFRHAANFTGRRVRPVPPVSDVYRVARVVVGLVDRPRAEAVVGNTHRVLSWGKALFPRLYDRLAPGVMRTAGLEAGSVDADPGNVFRSHPGWNQVHGGWSRLRDMAALGRGVKAAGTKLLQLIRSVLSH